MKLEKTDPCPCGSGKTYERCCRAWREGTQLDSSVKKVAPTASECSQLAALLDAGRLAELENQARLLLERCPDSGRVWNLLGISLQMQGKDGLPALRNAAKFLPNDAEVHSNLGNALSDLGRLDEAETCYRKALQINPYSANVHSNLGGTLRELGRPDEAEASCRRAIQIKPNIAEAHVNLGNILTDLGRLNEAEASYRRAIQIKPNIAEAYSNLGNALRWLGRLAEAEASLRWALKIEPDFAQAHGNLGNVLLDLGKLDGAVSSYRRALEVKPDYAEAHSNMLFCLSHNEGLGAQALFAEHVRFGEQFESPLRANWPHHTNSRSPERCLQVGFVSGDFCVHAVANFIEPLLAHLCACPQLSLHAFANHAIDDSTTQRLREYFAHWYPIASLTEAALAEKIRAAGIDILIDLSGHTGKNRLLTFARKPAPVQVSWMGYPGTTGLRAMDYYLADRFLLPPGQFDGQFTEKIVRLPASAPFLPYKNAPPVNALPASINGYVTFGSFNRLNKLSSSTIVLWSQLLHALPDSRMLLGSMPQDGNVVALIGLFAREGVARERLIFHTRCGMDAYLELHQQVDICLDTFPYNGGTTTCHALWMGVPTLTLAGNTLPGRQGAALLAPVGLEMFVAHDTADFVQKGVYWACNLAELSDTRTKLRERFAQSPRGRPEMIASGLERALRVMWRRWCAGLPPESFELSQ